MIWENRKAEARRGQTCCTTIDGVDFKINEPAPFSAKWFSHKFKAAGLRYEIGLCIRTGHIVWANGGACSDLKMANDLFVQFLDAGERCVADKAYRNPRHFITPKAIGVQRHRRLMSCHETINKRIKQFNILVAPFRHDLSKH